MRTAGARLLTRAVARSDRSTAIAIASQLQLKVQTLTSWIQRSGGASIRQIRRELIVARLAALVEDPALSWPVITRLLGIPRTHSLLDLVHRWTNLPASLWREPVRAI
jgi:hypothetical protein